MNNKGFTLIETLMTIVVFSIVLALGGYAVTVNLKTSKDKALKVLKENIKSGAINYYNECKFEAIYGNSDSGMCGNDKIYSNGLTITINNLKDYGFLEGIMKEEDTSGELVIVNPVSGEDIGGCTIKLYYDSAESNYSLTTEETKDECQFIK